MESHCCCGWGIRGLRWHYALCISAVLQRHCSAVVATYSRILDIYKWSRRIGDRVSLAAAITSTRWCHRSCVVIHRCVPRQSLHGMGLAQQSYQRTTGGLRALAVPVPLYMGGIADRSRESRPRPPCSSRRHLTISRSVGKVEHLPAQVAQSVEQRTRNA